MLVSTAIYFFGLTSILIGIDAIKSKKIIMPSVYSRRLKETYKGIAGVAHGIIFLLLGSCLVYVNYLSVNNSGSEFFKRAIKNPGFLLLIIGLYLTSSCIIAFVGYEEQKQTTKFVYFIDLFSSRLLPGLILFIWSIIILALGVLELLNPQYFDRIGGSYLEIIFNVI